MTLDERLDRIEAKLDAALRGPIFITCPAGWTLSNIHEPAVALRDVSEHENWPRKPVVLPAVEVQLGQEMHPKSMRGSR